MSESRHIEDITPAAVHEIHNLHQTRMFYYRNIAQLRGLEYSAHPICPVGCIARVKNGSTLISPAQLERSLSSNQRNHSRSFPRPRNGRGTCLQSEPRAGTVGVESVTKTAHE